MKNLILLIVLFIPFSLIAQNNVNIKNAKMDEQTKQWMIKISSDSEMRSTMMSMMIQKTNGNKEEMTKLMDSIMNNSEMRNMMLAMHTIEPESRNISLEPRGMKSDSIKVMKMYKTTTPTKN